MASGGEQVRGRSWEELEELAQAGECRGRGDAMPGHAGACAQLAALLRDVEQLMRQVADDATEAERHAQQVQLNGLPMTGRRAGGLRALLPEGTREVALLAEAERAAKAMRAEAAEARARMQVVSDSAMALVKALADRREQLTKRAGALSRQEAGEAERGA